jgi:hypothetical protein
MKVLLIEPILDSMSQRSKETRKEWSTQEVEALLGMSLS